MKMENERIEAEKKRVREEALQLAMIFETIGAFKVKRKGGRGKQIFGSVTAQDLVDIVKAQLQRFDCSNNRLSTLPSSLGHCTNLAELKASNNIISSLPEELANCSKLSKLDMEGNKLVTLSHKLIASCPMLMELNASKNLLSSLPESIGCLARFN